MISKIENETIDDTLSYFYDRSENDEVYELKITSGGKAIDVCDESITGNHLTNSDSCYTCYNMNKFKNILHSCNEITDDLDVICGATKKKRSAPRMEKMVKEDSRQPTTNMSPDSFINEKQSPLQYVNTNVHELAKKIFNSLKARNINQENLNEEILNSIPKGLKLMQTEYYDIYQIILNLYRNNKETTMYSVNKHPLVRLTMDSENKEIVYNFIQTISMISNATRVNEFHKKVKYQSLSYGGIKDLENRTIRFSSDNSINAILFTFAACKLSFFENVAVVSSSDTLLLQLYNKKKILKSDNFALAISRYSNIENEAKSSTITTIADQELRRVNAHILFKKLVLNIRMGNFDMKDIRELESYILGIKSNEITMQFNISEEENYLKSFFNIFGFNPILVRKANLMNNIYPIKAVPFLPINATQKLGTIENPIKLSSDMDLLVNFDALNNRIQVTPSYKNTKYVSETGLTPALSTLINPATNSIYFNQMASLAPTPLLINGTMIYAINRINIDLLNKRGVGELSHIYTKDILLSKIEYEDKMVVNHQIFNLAAVVCYKIEEESTMLEGMKIASAIGFVTFIKVDDNQYFCYDDCMNLTSKNRDDAEKRLLKNYYTYKVNNGIQIEEGNADFETWKDTSPIAKELLDDFKKDFFNYFTFIYSRDEVYYISLFTSYLFVYTMDYDIYMTKD